MQLRECVFVLPGGRKCRAAANRGQAFCRHHGPARTSPAPIPPGNRFSRIGRWVALGRDAGLIPVEQVPPQIFAILESLSADGDDGISDRVAGRLLRRLLRRLPTVDDPENPAWLNQQPALRPAAPIDVGSDYFEQLVSQLGKRFPLVNYRS